WSTVCCVISCAIKTSCWPMRRRITRHSNRHPPMTLRINCRHGSAESYVEVLQASGRGAKVLGGAAVRLDVPCNVRDLPGFAEGQVSVQDFGAQQAALRLDVADGMRVLDACAAPGGKSGHLLELADIELTALDIDATRLERVAENLSRLKLNATLAAADAAKPDSWWDGKPFDRILADVPCSASGVVRRNPDIKWLRRPEDFAALGLQQAAMLDALWPLLASGGKMLYATCSIMPEENQQQLDAFLKRHGDALSVSSSAITALPVAIVSPSVVCRKITSHAMRRLLLSAVLLAGRCWILRTGRRQSNSSCAAAYGWSWISASCRGRSS
uniref:SAM-dependent MTase RsmB/NOP-type domain-containing protein n=1 Tax=Hucho hucho TaxID=62062 RepID=A0A4W5LT52_9TELE